MSDFSIDRLRFLYLDSYRAVMTTLSTMKENAAPYVERLQTDLFQEMM